MHIHGNELKTGIFKDRDWFYGAPTASNATDGIGTKQWEDSATWVIRSWAHQSFQALTNILSLTVGALEMGRVFVLINGLLCRGLLLSFLRFP